MLPTGKSTQRRSDDSGFTLVELLIIVVVLGLLAAIVILAVGGARENALQSVCDTRVRSIAESAEAVHVKTDVYPAGTVDETTALNPLIAPQTGALLKGWPTNSEFVLRYVGVSGMSYTIDVYKSDGFTAVAGCSAL